MAFTMDATSMYFNGGEARKISIKKIRKRQDRTGQDRYSPSPSAYLVSRTVRPLSDWQTLGIGGKRDELS